MRKPPTQDDIIKVLQQVDDDPESFLSFMEMWNTAFDLSQRRDPEAFAGVEQAAIASINLKGDPKSNTIVGRHVGQLLEKFASPAFLVQETGEIISQNSAAISAFGVGQGDSLDDLPFNLELNEPIADVVHASLSPTRNLHDAVLRRAYSTNSDTLVTLSIAPSKPISGGKGEALVFIIDARWKTSAAGLIKQEFDLTDTERALLEGFLDGKSTQEMAQLRNRSHATVRTQFHSLMTKMGSRNQTELFRNALSVSQFIDNVDEIAEVMRHPYRKRVDLLRPGGGSVEVTITGDWSGTPVVFLQSGAAYTFEQHIEQAFYEGGICMLSVCRPGWGDTDPAPEGQTNEETFAKDVRALLDQLGHQTCLLMASNTSCGYLYKVSEHLQDRLCGLFQMAAPAPNRYSQAKEQGIPWGKAILHAQNKFPNIVAFMVKTGAHAWIQMGQKRYFASQLPKEKELLKRLLEPGSIAESQRALDVATKQNADGLANDVVLAFSDFTDAIQSTTLPILLIHGTRDPIFPIASIRAFAADYEDRIAFIEMPDVGYAPMDTHAPQVVQDIVAFVAKHTATKEDTP